MLLYKNVCFSHHYAATEENCSKAAQRSGWKSCGWVSPQLVSATETTADSDKWSILCYTQLLLLPNSHHHHQFADHLRSQEKGSCCRTRWMTLESEVPSGLSLLLDASDILFGQPPLPLQALPQQFAQRHSAAPYLNWFYYTEKLVMMKPKLPRSLPRSFLRMRNGVRVNSC